MFSRFSYVIARVSVSFLFIAELYSIVRLDHILFFQFVSFFRLWRLVLLCTFICMYLFGYLFSILWGVYIGVELLGHMGILCLTFWGTTRPELPLLTTHSTTAGSPNTSQVVLSSFKRERVLLCLGVLIALISGCREHPSIHPASQPAAIFVVLALWQAQCQMLGVHWWAHSWPLHLGLVV